MSSYMCVTVKGDKYSPQGTLEGGFNKQAGILMQVEKYKTIADKKTNLYASKERIENNLRELNKISNLIYLIKLYNRQLCSIVKAATFSSIT